MKEHKLLPLHNTCEVKNYLSRLQFMTSSFQLYEGASGFQDFGINGFQIKKRITEAWKHFMFDEKTFEVETPQITPFSVLKASGHADRFFDYVIFDKESKCHRADHIVEDHMKLVGDVNSMKADGMSPAVLEQYIRQHRLLELSSESRVIEKLLSFTIPKGHGSEFDFLRPELAQGIFVNMKQYLDYFQNRLPFAIAQVGHSFRYEISPQPFTRLREFTQAEIEFVFNPLYPVHPNFHFVKENKIPLLTSAAQEEEEGKAEIRWMTAQDAIKNGVICNEIVAYFMSKIFTLALSLGLKPETIRFRQHLKTQMAHYSIQCWDLECLISNTSWLECAGIAHRGCHDLTAHNVGNVFVLEDKSVAPIVSTVETFNYKEIAKVPGINIKDIVELEKKNWYKQKRYFGTIQFEPRSTYQNC